MGVFSVIYLLAMLSGLSMEPIHNDQPMVVEGRTMGTTYRVVYFDGQKRDLKSSLDSLLLLVNKAISVYDPSSEISTFNKSRTGTGFILPYFEVSLRKALEVASASKGAFDPTVLPLVNAWGFGPEKSLSPNKRQIDSLRAFIGYEKIVVKNDSVKKKDTRVQLDFGGIGQGYGADVVAGFLKSRGIVDFLVELGGEGVASGKNLQKGEYWRVGILDPNSTQDNQFFKAYVTLRDRSFTTAGNYFNYRIVNGIKYGHTIDPRTGYPVQHTLLSASVFANDCATADAWDTALMVAGVEEAIAMLRSNPALEALLIFSTPEGGLQTYSTPGIKEFIVIEP